MTDSFTHLHVHSEYSMLDGAARIKDVVQKAKQDGQPAVGVTDHGNMYGVPEFYKACQSVDIKPIIGTEAYMADMNRFERPLRRSKKTDDSGGEVEGGHKLYYHITLLAENNEGYKNLIQIASRAFLEGYYYKPRVDWEVLNEHSAGVIATSGCLGGHVLQSLMNDGYDAALKKAGLLQDIFGRDNFFIEIQDHGIQAQHDTNPDLIKISREIGAPLLLTNDSHYVNADDQISHDALLCVQTKARLGDEHRFRFEGHEHYLKTAAEMRGLFPDYPEACDNTLLIAERADVELAFGETHLPEFPVPEKYKDDYEYLERLTLAGARKRWGDYGDDVADRLAFELKTIQDMGFVSYFLIVWDLTRFAREEGIRMGPARGSAGGCAVSYCLGITNVDPLEHDLLFERFLNPSRISMPDIDMDFDTRYRDHMINYAAEKYGKDHVAQIITFGSIKARAAVRDSTRVLDLPYALGDKISRAMPGLISGRDTPLHACINKEDKHAEGYERASGVRDLYDSDEDCRKIIDIALGLEDLKRQDGVHAAAVVISPEPLMTYLPIQRKPQAGSDPQDAPIITQYDMDAVEELGLLKMDFLGLRNLDIITDTLKLIEEDTGEKIDIDNIPMDDEATFKLLQAGNTIGVFQLEGKQMRELMRALRPTEFDDVAALIALYRPGPMADNMHYDYADRKNGRKPVEDYHPDLHNLMSDTYGLMIYQEKLMRAAQILGNYSLAEADNLRKACGKKKPELIAKEKEKFIPAVVNNGYSEEFAKKMFGIIEPFADYAFNKSHAVGYGYISYQTAWLKANYPIYYMSCLLSSVSDKQEKLRIFLNECRRMDIEVTVPDINLSEAHFRPHDGKIVFGLTAVRGLGEGWAEKVVAERDVNGPFGDFYDFCDRIPKDALNAGALEASILSGCFDKMYEKRRGLYTAAKEISKDTAKRRKVEDAGQMGLFEETGGIDRIEIPDIEFDSLDRLAREKDLLGVYVSENPLLPFEEELSEAADESIHDVVETQISDWITIAGIVSQMKPFWTRKGDKMATCFLEDFEGQVEVVIFPKTMQNFGHLLKDDAVVAIQGRYAVERAEDANFVANEVTVIAGATDTEEGYKVTVGQPDDWDDYILRLKKILAKHKGATEVQLVVGDETLTLPDNYRVNPTLKLDMDIAQLSKRSMSVV